MPVKITNIPIWPIFKSPKDEVMGSAGLRGFLTVDSQLKWDKRMLGLARYIGMEWSQDPSSKVGCVIAQGKDEVGYGYNGFPPGVNDAPERYADRVLKYELVIHAEPNALFKAAGRSVGATAYTWPFPPCSRCAGLLVRHGIKCVVTIDNIIDPARVQACRFDLTELIFQEAGVEMVTYRELLTRKADDKEELSFKRVGSSFTSRDS